jgi:chaperonin cofactor prefoldin
MSEDSTKKLLLADSDKLTLILTTVQSLDRRSITVETQFGTFEARLERLELRFENFNSRLQRIEQRIEQRLYDTRPIWHKVIADIGQLQESQSRLEKGQNVLNDAIRKINGDFHAIDERLRGIEVNRNRQNSST